MNNFQEDKISIYNNLCDNYFSIINDLIDFSSQNKIIPIKMNFYVPLFKDYLNNNKTEVIQNSLKILLEYKNEILNFSIDSLSQNNSNIIEIKEILNKNNLSKEIEIFNLFIEIKDNAILKLKLEDREIVKEYIELIILILEKIKNLFI